jgi:nucleotide-binding universal stress UspA family protein
MKVLVPTDFSLTSKTGLYYAISFIANYGEGHVHVLHAIQSQDELSLAEVNLKQFCNIQVPKGITISSNITVGDFSEEIGKEAQARNCALIIMASKGAVGIQKLVGSRALKVVSQSNIPHIITQREVYDDEKIDLIAFPITLEREDKKILNSVAAIAKPLKASVLLIYEDKNDEFLSATISRNLRFAKNYLRRRGINTQAIDVGHDLRFDEAIIKYAAAHECDLIATVNHHNDGFLNLFGANFDQNLLENYAHIPVLTVEARIKEHVNDIFMTTM